MKAALALLLALVASAARAQPCTVPTPTVGFGQSFYNGGLVNGFVYDQTLSNLFVTWRTRQYTLYLGVPVGVAQAFTLAITGNYVSGAMIDVYAQD